MSSMQLWIHLFNVFKMANLQCWIEFPLPDLDRIVPVVRGELKGNTES